MKIWSIIGILVLCVCLGCAVQKMGIVKPEDYTIESFIKEKTKNLTPDAEGWRVLGIPDKDFDNNAIEFVLCTKGLSWGAGFVQQVEGGGTALVLYVGASKKWYFASNGFPQECTPAEARASLDALWELMKQNADFAKMRPFKILTPVPKGSI